MTPSADATAHPSRAERSTSTSSGASSWPAARKRPSPRSSNSPAASAARTAPSSLPSFGPSTGRFGFTTSSASTWPSATSFTRSSSRTIATRSSAGARAFDDEPRERLAQLDARRRPRGAPEVDDAARVRHRGERRRRRAVASPGQPARKTESGASWHGSRTSTCQRCSARNGITGAITRSACAIACQSDAQRGLVPLPEAPPRAADVPVREVVDERLERPDHVDRQPALVAGGRLLDEQPRALDEPAVERRDSRPRPRSRSA